MAGVFSAPALSRSLAPLLVFASALGACTPTTKLEGVRGYARVGRTQGGSVVVTQDERVAVVTNRTDGVVSVVRLTPGAPAEQLVTSSRADIPVHPLRDSKPWASVIAPDDDTAYVLLRGLSKVVRLVGLHGEHPHFTDEIAVGAEPTALVISPSGKELFVANSNEGSVTSIVIGSRLVSATWDLNSRLVSAEVLGPIVGDDSQSAPSVWSTVDIDKGRRPGLAHPRALAITDSGDDDDSDEMLYATEFFGQPLPGGGPGGTDDVDHSRIGVVYPILLTGQPPPDKPVITLQPVDVGFQDSEGNITGCFPNQLYSATESGGTLFVTGVCASPSGPVEPGPPGDKANNNFKTLVHSVVYVIDTTAQAQLVAPLVLTDKLASAYAEDGADAGTVRMPLLPTELLMTPPDAAGNIKGYLSALGSSAVYPLTFSADGTASLGSAGRRYIDVGDRSMPTGVAVLSGDRALVVDDHAGSLGTLELADARQARVFTAPAWQSSPDNDPAEVVTDDERDGRQLFSTGLHGWSFQGQGWSSCESCHPEGGSDGVTWRFTRGPRRSISLAGTYFRDEPTRRIMLWTANIDELQDVEGIARRVSGGLGGVTWNPYAQPPSNLCRLLYAGEKRPDPAPASDTPPPCPMAVTTKYRANNLNGSLSGLGRVNREQHICTPAADGVCDINGSFDWAKLDAFARGVRAPRAPAVDSSAVAAGKSVFLKKRCNGCHAGAGWTLSRLFYEPGVKTNGELPFDAPAQIVAEDVPTLRGSLRTRQFLVQANAPDAFRVGPGAAPSAASLWSFRPSPDETLAGNPDALAHELEFLFTKPPANDQLRCGVRQVGTFDKVPSAASAPPVHEVRRTLDTDTNKYTEKTALGDNGFNIPSLVGLAAGAPYFHAGNARTLEEVFDPKFSKHTDALNGDALSAADVRNLVSYLLSLDESPEQEPPSPLSADALGFNPDLCAQFGSP